MPRVGRVAEVVDIDERGRRVPGTTNSASIRERDPLDAATAYLNTMMPPPPASGRLEPSRGHQEPGPRIVSRQDPRTWSGASPASEVESGISVQQADEDELSGEGLYVPERRDRSSRSGGRHTETHRRPVAPRAKGAHQAKEHISSTRDSFRGLRERFNNRMSDNHGRSLWSRFTPPVELGPLKVSAMGLPYLLPAPPQPQYTIPGYATQYPFQPPQQPSLYPGGWPAMPPFPDLGYGHGYVPSYAQPSYQTAPNYPMPHAYPPVAQPPPPFPNALDPRPPVPGASRSDGRDTYHHSASRNVPRSEASVETVEIRSVANVAQALAQQAVVEQIIDFSKRLIDLKMEGIEQRVSSTVEKVISSTISEKLSGLRTAQSALQNARETLSDEESESEDEECSDSDSSKESCENAAAAIPADLAQYVCHDDWTEDESLFEESETETGSSLEDDDQYSTSTASALSFRSRRNGNPQIATLPSKAAVISPTPLTFAKPQGHQVSFAPSVVLPKRSLLWNPPGLNSADDVLEPSTTQSEIESVQNGNDIVKEQSVVTVESSVSLPLLDTKPQQTGDVVSRSTINPRSQGWSIREVLVALQLPRLLEVAQEALRHESTLAEGKARLHWTCECGTALYDDFVELKEGAVKRLEHCLNAEKNSPPPSIGGSSVLTKNSFGVSRLFKYSWLKILGHVVDQEKALPQFNSATTAGVHASSENTRPPPDPLHLLMCRRDGTFTRKLLQPGIEHVDNDAALFRLLRRSYRRTKGIVWSFVSFKTPAKIQFVKFEMYDPQEFVQIKEVDVYPPPDHDHYSYDPRATETIPPLGDHRLMHYFDSPEHAGARRAFLALFPKKLKGELHLDCTSILNPESDTKETGWGLHFVETWDFRKMGIVCIGFLGLGGVMFGVLFAVLQKSIQDAFAVAATMVSLASMLMCFSQAAIEFNDRL